MATGHIRKRTGKNGEISYQLVVEDERNPLTGKRERHYKTVSGTKKQAEATLRKMISDLESGEISTPSAMRLGDWLKHWLETYCGEIAVSTKASYEEKVNNYVIPTLGHIPLKALKTDNVQMFINDLKKKGLSPKTIRNTYNNLNAALKKAVTLRMIPFNPCVGTVLPKLEQFQDNVYGDEEITKALKAAENTDMYLMLFLLYTVGMRRGELDALRWKHIDFNNNIIHICESRTSTKGGGAVTKSPKTKAGNRKITVGDEVITVLKKAKEEYDERKLTYGANFHDDGYVICKNNGEPYRPDSLTQKWLRFLKKYDLEHIRLHGLRHSNATALIHAGVSPRVVQQRLGHADINITLNTYTHVLPEMDREAAEKIDNLIIKAKQA